MTISQDRCETPWQDLIEGEQLGCVNLALLGPARGSSRLARLIFLVLVRMTTPTGQPAFREAVVLLPPDAQDNVAAEVAADTAQFRGYPLDAEELGALSQRLKIRRIESFDTAEILQAVTTAMHGSFIIVASASRYRPAEYTSTISTSTRTPEDCWVPPLIELATQCTAQIAEENCVLFDVGEYLPTLNRNIEALQNLGCTVWGAKAPLAVNDEGVAKFENWKQRVARGDILSTLGEIDALAGTTIPERLLLKIQALHKGGRSIRALEFLREYLPHIAEIPALLKLKLVEVALASEDHSLALELFESSVGALHDLDVNERALELTQSIPSASIEAQCLSWLARFFPTSLALKEHQLRRLFLAARDGLPVRPENGPRLPLDEYVDAVLTPFRGEAAPDYAAHIEKIDAKWPTWQAPTRLAAAFDARRRDLPIIVAMIAPSLAPDSALARPATTLLLWSIEQLILAGDDRMREQLADAVVYILLYLSAHPADTGSRERLDELLSVDVAGRAGAAILAYALLRLADTPTATPDPSPLPTTIDIDSKQFMRFYHEAAEWLNNKFAINLADVVLPKQLLTLPADSILLHLKQMTQFVIEQEQEDDGQLLRLTLIVAFAVAPHANRRNDDLAILRLVTSRLVVAGDAQLARDFVEAALATTQEQPDRLRLAWFAYGDVFQRMHNNSRALLAFGCALATQGPVDPEHKYYETMGIVRALRDVGLFRSAHEFLDRCEKLLIQMDKHATMGHRIQTVRLGLQMLELGTAHLHDEAAWSSLLREIDENLQTVKREKDELATVLVMAVQVLRQAESMGLEIAPQIRARIEDAMNAAGKTTAELVQLASNASVGAERLLNRARAAQHARYSDDVGFDVQHLVRAARNQLSEDATLADAKLACFAAELTTDHAIKPPGSIAGGWLPATIEESSQTLEDLSHRGPRIEMLVIDNADRLVRVSADAGVLTAQREDAAFSLRGLQNWSRRFPYDYGLDASDPNIFYTSLSQLGLSQEPAERAVFVLDTRLQRFPPQLLMINGEMLGRSCAIAVAPSLTWLRASTSAPRRPQSPSMAWISTAVEGDGRGTLATVADRVTDVLAQHGITLQTGNEIPENLKGARMAIIAAHGGLADENRFFKVLSDEAKLRISSLTLARALEGVGIAILFVCSGGRQDEHPSASTTVGLPKQLLDRGSMAVIASPWPLDSRVPSHWLPAFLVEWEAGAMLIDANAAGNRAVGAQMGNEPRDALAMTLYGNPFLRRTDFTDP